MNTRRSPRDPNGRHVRIYCTLLNSPAWRTLGWSSRGLFIDLRATVTGTNNGNISATLSDLKHRGWGSSATLANALFELQALGFLAKTRNGGIEVGSDVCCLYRFTDLDCFEFPALGIDAKKASHDYLKFDTVTKAEIALRDAKVMRNENAKGKKIAVQKLKRTASETEAQAAFSASVSEVDAPSALQKLKQAKARKNEPKPLRHKGCAPIGRRIQ